VPIHHASNGCGIPAKHVTGTGYVSKAKREVHEHTQNKVETKYPAHNLMNPVQ
jgi:hypothetical protein